MVTLNYKNIIRLFAYGCRNKEVFYVMEYADGRSLWDVIIMNGAVGFEKYMKYSIDIVSGLKYLHKQKPPVEHRDLKPENVLLCGNMAKICDFGVSSARETISRTTGFQGTFNYAPPEYFDSMKGYGPLSDIYSFALVVWVMLEGKRPYDSLNHGQIMAEKIQQRLPTIPPATPSKLASLLSQCWIYEPRDRPAAAKLKTKLADIQKNPGPALGSKVVTVREMDTIELVKYLQMKKVLPAFIEVVNQNHLAGRDFVDLQEVDLLSAPFGLTGVQAKLILKFVSEAKSA